MLYREGLATRQPRETNTYGLKDIGFHRLLVDLDRVELRPFYALLVPLLNRPRVANVF